MIRGSFLEPFYFRDCSREENRPPLVMIAARAWQGSAWYAWRYSSLEHYHAAQTSSVLDRQITHTPLQRCLSTAFFNNPLTLMNHSTAAEEVTVLRVSPTGPTSAGHPGINAGAVKRFLGADPLPLKEMI